MPDISRLIFDDKNEEHIARHGVTPEEVREACESQPLVRRGRANRLAVYGRTLAGRYLLAILEPAGAANYVVTARDMSRAERRRYTGARGK